MHVGIRYANNRRCSRNFGIAAVDFTLADEVNMGTYTLRAILPQGQAEKKVRVERYVLPKFKTTLTTEKPYYLPGDTVKGSVQADYFFGKPVAGSLSDGECGDGGCRREHPRRVDR